MNILMVTLAYEPAIAFGGPVKVVQNNARELAPRGHQVTVYCTNRFNRQRKMAPHTVERDDQGVRIVYHNTWFLPGWRGNFGPSISVGMIASLLREGGAFDIIHINEARAFTTILAGLYAQTKGIPYIIQAHGSFVYGLRHQRMKRMYDLVVGRNITRKAARVVALTPGEIPECEAIGVAYDKITVIGNGIDLSAWQIDRQRGAEFRVRWGIPPDSLLVLFLGRIDKTKGPDLLVEALGQLKAQDVYCIFAGPDDGYLEYTRKMVSAHVLSDRVIFTGPLRDGEVMAAYAAADVFALPSRFDTFPMTIVEALASGLPILTTDTCQVAGLINDRAGVVVPVDPAAIANGLQRLLDSSLRETYSQGARNLAETEFSIQRTVDRLEKVYKQVLEERGRS